MFHVRTGKRESHCKSIAATILHGRNRRSYVLPVRRWPERKTASKRRIEVLVPHFPVTTTVQVITPPIEFPGIDPAWITADPFLTE